MDAVTLIAIGVVGYLLLTSSTNNTSTLAALLKPSSSSGGKSGGSSGGGGNSGSGSSLGQGNSGQETLAQYIAGLDPQDTFQTQSDESGLATSIPLQTVTDGSAPIFDVGNAIDQALGIATDPTSLSTTSDSTDLSDTYIGAATDGGGDGGLEPDWTGDGDEE